MKKFITTLLSLALVIGMCPAMIANAETTLSGTGVEGDPYIIATVADLKAARDMINADTAGTGAAAAYYEVTADITLPDGESWTPIGVYSTATFKGHFDGGNHAIKNISIVLDNDSYDANYTAAPYLGFFGRVHGATISNLGIENVVITNDTTWQSNAVSRKVSGIGGFAGCANSSTTITDCYVKNANLQHRSSVMAASVGGFVGCGGGNATPSFKNCYVYGATLAGTSTSNRSTVHGFIGAISNTLMKFENCYTADVATTQRTVELTPFYAFGHSWYDPIGDVTYKAQTITNCYSEADDIACPENGTHDYDVTKSAGTIGMTKAGLVEAMTALGYETVATINNGYPCLAWEIPEVEAWDGVAATEFAGGDGTEENPYVIQTAAQLKLASDTVNGRASDSTQFYFILANDIDYENNAWVPIGYSNTDGSWMFRGGFDGNGHVVRNLGIAHTQAFRYAGFFGGLNNATVKDLGIENFQLVHNNASTSYEGTNGTAMQFTYIGGFAAHARNNTTITNCYLKDSVVRQTSLWSKCESYLSGFLGQVDLRGSAVEVTNCYAKNVELGGGVQIPVSSFFSGVTQSSDATATNVKLTNCYVANITNANTQATLYAFGFMGGGATSQLAFDASKVIISNCYSTATTTEGSYAAKADSNKWQLVAGTYFGTEAQTVTQIATAFASLTGWQDGENINAGLPALAWEPAPVILPYVVKQVSTAKDTVTLEINKADTTGDKIYIATYDSEGRLVAADVQNVATTITTAVDSAATVKVFIWNNNNPVIDAVVKASY